MTYGHGAHLALVEVDGETGVPAILRYAIAYDVGRAINPMLVEGQIVGRPRPGPRRRAARGARLRRRRPARGGDAHGVPAAGGRGHAALRAVGPRGGSSPTNPLGVKGAGEDGIVAAGAPWPTRWRMRWPRWASRSFAAASPVAPARADPGGGDAPDGAADHPSRHGCLLRVGRAASTGPSCAAGRWRWAADSSPRAWWRRPPTRRGRSASARPCRCSARAALFRSGRRRSPDGALSRGIAAISARSWRAHTD